MAEKTKQISRGIQMIEKKCSVFNICSTWLEGLKFSSEMAKDNAWFDSDYILILWNPSKEVENYSKSITDNVFFYKTDKNLTDMGNLRNCFNLGRDKSFEFNNFSAGLNTDIICGQAWLLNLMKYAEENSIINCRQIEPGVYPSLHETHNFGIPGNDFNLKEFLEYCQSAYQDKLITEQEWGRRVDSTPHLISKKLWETVGHWEVEKNNPPADVSWFDKSKAMGFKNLKSLGSFAYHYGAVETNLKRKEGEFK